ncbi:hypothetical protein HNR65_001373 [Desulfosalsimonas propionicica]|uniref:Urease accessory protein UreH-like transmembrane domain-containing protein n=2 Tax=Desulfosalsimonas propionicica TaxID=332175 RepID=A0A7W0C8E3_9BACT|nr:hypothetical protein [Desulfosalsimonas propionicica]
MMWSTESIYAVFLATGFTVGFGHCIGMCGPIVISVSLQLKDRPSFLPQLYYNIGRTITYSLLGAIMGATASFTRFASEIGGFQKTILVFAGVLIIVMGLAMTGWVPAGRIFQNAPPLAGFARAGFKRILDARRAVLFLPLGMVLGLLPCGPVYTAMIAAARMGMEAESTFGGMISGAGVMACFGIGTIPALLLLSQVSNVKWLKHRDLIYKFGGVMMILVGIYFTWKGWTY